MEFGEKEGFLNTELLQSITEGGGLGEIAGVSKRVKELFVTSFEIPPVWHVKMQAAFQEFTDNAVSKTINFSQHATKDQVREAFLMAYQERCKGITIYRSGSKGGQVLSCGTRQVC